MVLIEFLPPESAFHRARNQGWSEQEQLVALTAMSAFFTGRNVAAAAGVPNHKLPKPLDIPSPHARQSRSRPRREPLTRHDWYRMLMPPKR